MRVLLLLRGSAGCGKSTWIEQNGLKPYALSADDIRLQCASPVMTVSGGEAINATNDGVVWDLLFRILETRMKNGEFTVIDATNSKTAEMNRYKKLCSDYRYRIYCVDFTGIPIEVTKERNRNRPELKRVPEEVIDKMYARFETQKIPSGITVFKPDELDKIFMEPMDLSEYRVVHHIGDIHGCYTALKEYFDNEGGLKPDEFYIFTGDYIDRGIENAEVINFLLSIYKQPNVMLLEGNHERHLWTWANNHVGTSKAFEFYTRHELEEAGIDKKEVRQLYRRFAQCAYYKYGKAYVLVTHGGLSNIPDKLTYVATQQMIKGVGNYNDCEAVANAFIQNTSDNYYQIFGHRNPKGLPVRVNSGVFCLEGRVEFGGCLRCVQLNENGIATECEIKNDVFRDFSQLGNTPETEGVGDLILALRENHYVNEKQFGDISSFNFSSQAFYKQVWDTMTTKARGLYINIPKQKIVARSYDKFFNIGERPETELGMLQGTLKFPVTAYVKENGYLGIVSYDEDKDDLFVATKSSTGGEHVEWLKDALHKQAGEAGLEKLKQYAKDNNVTFVFENVDMEHDPHVISYPESKLFLLDIIYNDTKYRKLSYSELCEVAKNVGLETKEKSRVLGTWQDFFDWYQIVTSSDYKWNGHVIEGFVIEDSAGYMTKLKLTYYNFWKFMRSISWEAIKKGYIDPRRTSLLTTPLANKYYAWVKTLHDVENPEELPKDICTLRNMFYETEAGSEFKE